MSDTQKTDKFPIVEKDSTEPLDKQGSNQTQELNEKTIHKHIITNKTYIVPTNLNLRRRKRNFSTWEVAKPNAYASREQDTPHQESPKT